MAGKYGELLKTGEFLMAFSELPDLSLPNLEWEKTPLLSSNNNESITLNGHNSSTLTGSRISVVGGPLNPSTLAYSSSGILQK